MCNYKKRKEKTFWYHKVPSITFESNCHNSTILCCTYMTAKLKTSVFSNPVTFIVQPCFPTTTRLKNVYTQLFFIEVSHVKYNHAKLLKKFLKVDYQMKVGYACYSWGDQGMQYAFNVQGFGVSSAVVGTLPGGIPGV